MFDIAKYCSLLLALRRLFCNNCLASLLSPLCSNFHLRQSFSQIMDENLPKYLGLLFRFLFQVVSFHQNCFCVTHLHQIKFFRIFSCSGFTKTLELQNLNSVGKHCTLLLGLLSFLLTSSYMKSNKGRRRVLLVLICDIVDGWRGRHHISLRISQNYL